MVAKVRVAILAFAVLAALPRAAVAQCTSTDSLQRRIDVLERRSVDLERRVVALEALARTPTTPPIPTSPKLENWRKLQIGMSMDDVRALLGEPDRVDAGGITLWSWGNADVEFMSGKVSGWHEPRH